MVETVLSMLVSDRPGVLTKVTILFGHRGVNIHTLTVVPSTGRTYSRITITVRQSPDTLRQIYNQLEKLEDVKEVTLVGGKALAYQM